jgi:hypothetical protein
MFGEDACGALVLLPMRSDCHGGFAFRDDRTVVPGQSIDTTPKDEGNVSCWLLVGGE